jgi:uncharacterized delta-60 repeat protein
MSALSKLRRNIFDLQPLEIRRLLASGSISGQVLNITGTNNSETITLALTSTGRVSVTGINGTFPVGGSSGMKSINIAASGGNDTVTINTNIPYVSATIAGGSGSDVLTGGNFNDVLSGNDGDDRLDGRGGADLMTGGAGFDTANYSSRSSAITVTMGSGANDGSPGENDDVETEECIGGSGNDSIFGSSLNDFLGGGAGADSLTGNSGNDNITGSSGSDRLFGNNGNDFMQALDGISDTVNGGTNSDGTADFDVGNVDGIDVGSAPAPAQIIDLISKAGANALAATEAPAVVGAGPGDLDSAYGNNGLVIGDRAVDAIAIDSQGRVVYAWSEPSDTFGGGDDIIVARLRSDGTPDADFGGVGVGRTTVDFTQENGTGYGNDADFAAALVIGPSDAINVIAQTDGSSGTDLAVARLDSSGAFVDTFDGDGHQVVDLTGLVGSGYGSSAENPITAALDSEGRVLIATNWFDGNSAGQALVRLTADGALDNAGIDSLNGTGVQPIDLGDGATFDQLSAIAFQSSAGSTTRILIAGSASGSATIAGYLPTGGLDDGFGAAGVRQDSIGGLSGYQALAVTADNQIVAAGFSEPAIIGAPQRIGAVSIESPITPPSQSNFAIVAMYDSDAQADPLVQFISETQPGFGAAFNSVTIDPQGNILAAGEDSGDMLLARFTSALAPDTGFSPSGTVTTDFGSSDSALTVAVVSGGKIMIAGATGSEGSVFAAARFNGGGSGRVSDVIEGIDTFYTYDQLHTDPRPPLLQEHLDDMSPTAQFYVLSQPDPNGVVHIELDSKNNIVSFSNIIAGDGTATVAVDVDGLVLYYDPAKTTRIFIDGNGGNDSIRAGDEILIPLVIDGGSGNDALVGGGLDDVLFGDSGLDLLDGEEGNDVLAGGSGPDLLTGEDGNDILIGGSNPDALFGGAGEDILIGGTTAYDSDLAALDALSARWGQTDAYAARIADLRAGVGGPMFKLEAGTTVSLDKTADAMVGDGGLDWFFKHTSGNFLQRDIADNGAGEVVDLV